MALHPLCQRTGAGHAHPTGAGGQGPNAAVSLVTCPRGSMPSPACQGRSRPATRRGSPPRGARSRFQRPGRPSPPARSPGELRGARPQPAASRRPDAARPPGDHLGQPRARSGAGRAHLVQPRSTSSRHRGGADRPSSCGSTTSPVRRRKPARRRRRSSAPRWRATADVARPPGSARGAEPAAAQPPVPSARGGLLLGHNRGPPRGRCQLEQGPARRPAAGEVAGAPRALTGDDELVGRGREPGQHRVGQAVCRPGRGAGGSGECPAP